MAYVIFFEKPGCKNNTRQKAALAEAGHEVEAHNLLAHRWTMDTLRPFFGDLPVGQWFNPSAPRIKSGEVDPAGVDAATALAWMLADPLLIRRPLMQVGSERRAGFDSAAVDRWIGLKAAALSLVEACPKGHDAEPCPMPESA
jgi:nitrogenase-associated protein